MEGTVREERGDPQTLHVIASGRRRLGDTDALAAPEHAPSAAQDVLPDESPSSSERRR